LVFLDETAITTSMVRTRGRCPRGDRLVDYAPHGQWKTVTFIAGLRHDRMVAPFVIEGAMNGEIFRAYIESPRLRRCRCRSSTQTQGTIQIDWRAASVRDHAVTLVCEKYPDFGPTPAECRPPL